MPRQILPVYSLLRQEDGLVHTINLGIQAEAGIIVVDTMEPIDGICIYFFVSRFVPAFCDFTGIPALGIIDRRRQVEILEKGKRGTDRNFMLHTVFPVLYQVRLKKQIIFSLDTILQMSCITNRNFLIPTFFTHRLFPLKRINITERNCQIGQSNSN